VSAVRVSRVRGDSHRWVPLEQKPCHNYVQAVSFGPFDAAKTSYGCVSKTITIVCKAAVAHSLPLPYPCLRHTCTADGQKDCKSVKLPIVSCQAEARAGCFRAVIEFDSATGDRRYKATFRSDLAFFTASGGGF
jgi:hypothetical protein